MLKPMSFDVLEREVRKSTATDFIVELLAVLNGIHIQQSLRREVSQIKVHRKYTGGDSTQVYWCFGMMAERVGFEPTVRFPVRSLSRRVLSTTQSPLRSGRSV
jgi:hypothetical protein